MSRRSPWVVLAVLSLVGSLLALSAGPAISKNGEADDLALYSACLGSALVPAGFGDLPPIGSFRDAINCMAHYGIMEERLPGLFDPNLGVTRDQMALFLIRTAGPAGIDLPRPVDQGFEDIDDLPAEVRDAVNQLVELGITRGKTARSYDPFSVVTRRQMAVFLMRFLEEAPVAEGGVSIESVVPDDTQFEDIRDLPHDPYDAVRLLFEMGVTSGTSATTFGPDQPVTRAQMAVFISRMLAHTNARPAGITMQVENRSVTAGDSVDLVISVRDDDHQPMVDTPVDLFYVPQGDDGFVSSGRCGSKAVLEWGDTRCTIDLGDETTDGDGTLFYTMIVEQGLEMFAWTDDLGRPFDLDDTEYAWLVFNVSKPAENFLITDDMREGARKLPFGRTVTFTFQLVDEDETAVAEEDVEIRIETVEENDGRIVHDRTRTYATDSSGKVELSFRLSDPDSDDDDRDGELNMDVLSSDEPVIDKTTVRILTGSNRLLWSDNEEEPTTLLLEKSSAYTTVSDSGNGARNRVTATLLDQYGDPVRNVRVHFTSNDEEGLWHQDDTEDEARNAYRKTTSSKGVATVTYYRDSDEMGIETIYAATEDVQATAIEHYWVDQPPDDVEIKGEVVYHDAHRETLVVDDDKGNLYEIGYDRNDQFNHDKDGPIRYEAFKEAIDEGDRITIVIESNDPDDVNAFTIS